MNKVTPKQRLFISEYLKTLDGEIAAQKAGYKGHDLKVVADILLNQPHIINELNNQLQTQLASFQVQKGYVVQKLLQIAEFSLIEEDVTDKEGNPTGKKKLRDSSSALKALDCLCKYLWSKDESTSGLQAKIITISNLNDKKI